MTVRDGEGRRLGTVANLGDTYFELEQGEPARRDFAVNYHLVERVQGGDVILQAAGGVPTEDDGVPGGRAR
ncbi:DUF2171 domain-containing protein [Myxococcaceae bacterium GXIMD 01537]